MHEPKKPFEMENTESLRPIEREEGRESDARRGPVPVQPAESRLATVVEPVGPSHTVTPPAPADRSRRGPLLSESIIVLGLILIAAIGIWLLYGDMIGPMLSAVFGWK